jgi:steroid delta-isomerase-like uncharacterized protein
MLFGNDLTALEAPVAYYLTETTHDNTVKRYSYGSDPVIDLGINNYVSKWTPTKDIIKANKAIANRIFEEIWNEGNLDVADEILDSELVRHDSGNPSASGPVGREGFKQLVSVYRSAFPDIHWTINDMIAEDNLVASRWTATGTHQGELMGIPPTGASVTGTGISIVRIVDGKVKEEWADWDSLAMMQQLGVISPGRPSPDNYTWGELSEMTGDPGDPVANKALVTRFTEEVWNQQNLDVMDEIFIDEVISHNPPIDYLYDPSSLEVLKQGVTDYLTAFPDLHVVVEDTIAEGDMAVARWTVAGTHQGELMGIPATGNPISWTGHTMYRFADGKIVELWWAWDTLGMMQQISPELPGE